jgi:hypothetical protein
MSAPAPDAPTTPAGDDAASAVAELRILVHRLSDEVAAFRRRAIAAEGRVRELEARLELAAQAGAARPTDAGDAVSPDPEALARLERENAELRERLGQAAERTRQLLDRARFLRQQQGEADG